jgi:hypothetical protein
VLGWWCALVGVLILLVFLVLVSLMGQEHDTQHETWVGSSSSRAATAAHMPS